MARSVPVNWRVHIPEPVEVKMVSPTLSVRNAIDPLERYRGLFTYVVEDDTFYYLSEGISNNHWKPIGKPQAIIILDEFEDAKQTVISGWGLKRFLEANYFTKEEVTGLLSGYQIPPHLASITPEEVQKLKTIQGDISQRVDVLEPKTLWVIPHPSGKDCSAFNSQGREIFGRKINVSDTITSFNWSKPMAGYVTIN